MKPFKAFITCTNFRPRILLSSIALFALSLTQDCYCTENGCVASVIPFFDGWAGVLLFGSSMLSWIANPLLLASWLSMKRKPLISLIFSFIAATLTLTFLFVRKIYDVNDDISWIVTYYKTGYWLWVMSCWIMALGNLILYCRSKQLKMDILIVTFLTIGTCITVLGFNTTKRIDFLDYAFTGNLDTLSINYTLAQRKVSLNAIKNYLHDSDTANVNAEIKRYLEINARSKKTQADTLAITEIKSMIISRNSGNANYIIWQYHKYGSILTNRQLGGNSYPKLDSIIKYKNVVFDTTLIQRSNHHEIKN